MLKSLFDVKFFFIFFHFSVFSVFFSFFISEKNLKNLKKLTVVTYGFRTYRGPKQGKPGRNRNSSPGSVLVSTHYRFVKQYWLVKITGLYRVQVSEKYRFLPQRFNIHTYRGPKQGKPGRNRNSSPGSVLVSIHYWFVKHRWLVNITGLYRVQVCEKYWFLP